MTHKFFGGYVPSLCQRLLRQLGRLLFTGVMAWLPNAQAINLPESTNKLMFARELNRIYVDPLGMYEKPASKAFETLLGEGFRCGLQLVSPIGLNEPPLTRCVKLRSGFAPQCDELRLTVEFEPRPEIGSREELFGRLETVSVRSARAFCPYPDEVSVEFVAARGSAEEALAQQVSALGLLGNALAAYEKLLMKDYYCGFEAKTDEELGQHVSSAQMICTRWRTRIRYCHEARLVMDMDWPTGTSSIKQLYGALAQAKVKAVRSSCEVPNVRAAGRPM